MKNIYGSYHNSRSYLSKFIYAVTTNIITYLQTFNMHENKTSRIVHNIVKIQKLNYPKFKINNRLFCLLVLFYHGKTYTWQVYMSRADGQRGFLL